MGSFYSFFCSSERKENIIIVYNNKKAAVEELLESITGEKITMSEDVKVGDVNVICDTKWEHVIYRYNNKRINLWITPDYEPTYFFHGKEFPIVNIDDYGRLDNMKIENLEYSRIVNLMAKKEFRNSTLLSIVKSKINNYNDDIFFTDMRKDKVKLITTTRFAKEHFIDNLEWLLK